MPCFRKIVKMFSKCKRSDRYGCAAELGARWAHWWCPFPCCCCQIINIFCYEWPVWFFLLLYFCSSSYFILHDYWFSCVLYMVDALVCNTGLLTASCHQRTIIRCWYQSVQNHDYMLGLALPLDLYTQLRTNTLILPHCLIVIIIIHRRKKKTRCWLICYSACCPFVISHHTKFFFLHSLFQMSTHIPWRGS